MEEKIISGWNIVSNKYSINEFGVVTNLLTNKEISQREDKDGYMVLNLTVTSGRQQTFKVHRLVALCFIDNDDPTAKIQVNHKDENKKNNHYTNLEWCTHCYNINYGLRTIKAISNKQIKVICKNVSTNDTVIFDSISSASRFLNISESNINRALNGERNSTCGFVFYKPESPVYNVLAVPIEKIQANTYNPNHVAPPEMRLLYDSIKCDNYTMPIVCYYLPDVDKYEIVDGYHRYTTMKLHKDIYEREHGLLPVVVIDKPLSDRMASTVRHNRARGSHDIDLMVNIVAELKDSGMSDAWILKHLGMDAEELLRLKQISGLAALFKDREFTKAE